jgi:dTDP-4-amino-4,6-dideoxy-D-galactose acyltransferase
LDAPLNSPAEFLAWDTDFFGHRIGRVLTHNLSENEADRVDAWAFANKIDCVYYLAEGIDHTSCIAAENHHYHQVDLRVTYHIDLSRLDLTDMKISHVREAKESDIPQLRDMTRYNHQISRFFADDHFEREKCMRLYEIWIERDFHAQDHLLWVWADQDRPVGYTSVHMKKADNIAEIGLVGVHPDFRGRGMGKDLQLWVLMNLKKMEFDSVEVATQGRNIYAHNLYQKCGYRLKSINLWYHKWFQNS